IGYKTQEIPVTSEEVINVLLEEEVKYLEELVLIGYGTVRKSDLTGSVTSVGEEQMTKSATSDALQAIQGRAAGVQIITATGSPSATAEIKIRGTGSPNGTTPLYVVDGFPMNDIDYLSPGDISSIEILKDASACAIYGSRGANGVVLVTTKKGSAGALKSKVTAEYGIEALPTRPQMLNSSEYALLTNKAYTNSGLTPRYSNPNAMPYDTDWYGEVMRMGRYQNYNVSVSGGTEKINTLLSVGYFRRDGTVDGTNFGRFNITENTTVKMTSFLTINTSLQGSFAKSNSLGANGTNNNTIFLSSLIAPPDVPVWDESTNYYSGIGVIRLANPAGVISRNNNVSNRNFLVGNISADLTIHFTLWI
ncbi:MAG: TonB-dependent receptor plug domain-containing protein, partial [Candidatus Omnitrophota bacterium]